MRFLTASLLVFLIAAPAAVANPVQTRPTDLHLHTVATVTEVIKPNLIRLDDALLYKIDNIRVPVTYNRKVMEALNEKIHGKEIGIYLTSEKVTDRTDGYSHILSHLVTSDGIWVQEYLVSEGLALVDSTPDSRALVRPLYAAETAARKAHKGVWGDGTEKILVDATIQKAHNKFVVYEGVPQSFRKISSDFDALHFGKNTRTDFTLLLRAEDKSTFSSGNQTSSALSRLVGKNIRVRGWVTQHDGPMIYLTHPEILEYPQNPELVFP